MSDVSDIAGNGQTRSKPRVMIYGVGYYAAVAARTLVKKAGRSSRP